eukprot:6311924-Prymnesium_polylepis.1
MGPGPRWQTRATASRGNDREPHDDDVAPPHTIGRTMQVDRIKVMWRRFFVANIGGIDLVDANGRTAKEAEELATARSDTAEERTEQAAAEAGTLLGWQARSKFQDAIDRTKTEEVAWFGLTEVRHSGYRMLSTERRIAAIVLILRNNGYDCLISEGTNLDNYAGVLLAWDVTLVVRIDKEQVDAGRQLGIQGRWVHATLHLLNDVLKTTLCGGRMRTAPAADGRLQRHDRSGQAGCERQGAGRTAGRGPGAANKGQADILGSQERGAAANADDHGDRLHPHGGGGGSGHARGRVLHATGRRRHWAQGAHRCSLGAAGQGGHPRQKHQAEAPGDAKDAAHRRQGRGRLGNLWAGGVAGGARDARGGSVDGEGQERGTQEQRAAHEDLRPLQEKGTGADRRRQESGRRHHERKGRRRPRGHRRVGQAEASGDQQRRASPTAADGDGGSPGQGAGEPQPRVLLQPADQPRAAAALHVQRAGGDRRGGSAAAEAVRGTAGGARRPELEAAKERGDQATRAAVRGGAGRIRGQHQAQRLGQNTPGHVRRAGQARLHRRVPSALPRAGAGQEGEHGALQANRQCDDQGHQAGAGRRHDQAARAGRLPAAPARIRAALLQGEVRQRARAGRAHGGDRDAQGHVVRRQARDVGRRPTRGARRELVDDGSAGGGGGARTEGKGGGRGARACGQGGRR